MLNRLRHNAHRQHQLVACILYTVRNRNGISKYHCSLALPFFQPVGKRGIQLSVLCQTADHLFHSGRIICDIIQDEKPTLIHQSGHDEPIAVQYRNIDVIPVFCFFYLVQQLLIVENLMDANDRTVTSTRQVYGRQNDIKTI